MAGVSLRACSTSKDSFSPSGARLLRLFINSSVFTDSSYRNQRSEKQHERGGGGGGRDNGIGTFIVAWSVNSSSSEHCISLTAISLCSFVIANASLAWGDTDSLAAGTGGKNKTD